MEETPRDLTKPRIAPHKNTWKRLQNMVYWCNLKLAQEKGSHFYQTRSHAVVLHNTQPAACIEKAVCMKTQEELYQKVRLTPRLPRVVLKSNSQCGQQDLRGQDARSSWDPPSDSKSFRETCNNAVDCRIPGIPLSTVEQQDTTRENQVKKLIEKFENHQHKESFLQDLSQTQKINKSRRESQESRRAVARVYVCALRSIWCGVVYISTLVSCPFLCTERCGASRWRKRNTPPNPEGVTPAVALTALFFALPVHSCREGPEHFGSTPLAHRRSRPLWCVKPSTRVSCRWIYDPQPFQ